MASWHNHYDDGVPRTLEPYPNHTVLDHINNIISERPKHTALICNDVILSYSDLNLLSESFATTLNSLKVIKGSRIAIILPNSLHAIICQLGIWKAGGIAVPLNPFSTSHELSYFLIDCEAEAVVIRDNGVPKIKSMGRLNRLNFILSIDTDKSLEDQVLFPVDVIKVGDSENTYRSKETYLYQSIQKAIPQLGASVIPNDPALILYTGGTTGTPRGIVATHRAILIAGIQLHTWFGVTLVDWCDSIVLTFPLFHVAGNIGVFITGIIGRNPLIIIPDPRNIGDLVDTIQKYRPSFLPGVPTLFLGLLNYMQLKKDNIDLGSLKLCISGALKLRNEIKERFELETGIPIIEAYALTESMMASVIGPAKGKNNIGSVGLPLPDIIIRIVDVDTGKDGLGPGEVGEIYIMAPQFKDISKLKGETSLFQDGWLASGDIGYMDGDGFLFILDRKKDVIKSSGFQVWPNEVEEVLASHPAVAEVCVVGIPDDYQGETIKAFVVLNPGHIISSEKLKDYCSHKLTRYKIPRCIEFCDRLPKTTFGKISRKALVEI